MREYEYHLFLFKLGLELSNKLANAKPKVQEFHRVLKAHAPRDEGTLTPQFGFEKENEQELVLDQFSDAMWTWASCYRNFAHNFSHDEDLLASHLHSTLGVYIEDDFKFQPTLRNIEVLIENIEEGQDVLEAGLKKTKTRLDNLKRIEQNPTGPEYASPSPTKPSCSPTERSENEDNIIRSAVEPTKMPKIHSSLKDINVKLKVYSTGTTMNASQTLTIDEEEVQITGHLGNQLDSLKLKLMKPQRHAPLRIIIIVHGFTGNINKPWMEDMKKAIMAKDNSAVVFKLGWGEGCCDGRTQYKKAAANTEVVGLRLAKLVQELKNLFTPEFKPCVWIIGHSLGSHVAGKAGRESLGDNGVPLIDIITGLDPAGFGFEHFQEYMFSKKDAVFVDVIHTDGVKIGSRERAGWCQKQEFCDTAEADDYGFGYFGTMIPCGHLDFYPDGGHNQNEVGNNKKSHSEAINLFIKSISNKGLFATNKRFQHKPKKGEQPHRELVNHDCDVEMGFHCKHVADGQFYLKPWELMKGKGGTTLSEMYGQRKVRSTVPMEIYPQAPHLQRLVVLVNIEKYEDGVHKERLGSSKDFEVLKCLFSEELQKPCKLFELEKTVKREDLEDTIGKAQSWTEMSGKSQLESLVFIIMCHGSRDVIFTSEWSELDIREDMQQFDNGSCPHLSGVPKMFFFVCCRGDNWDVVGTGGRMPDHNNNASLDSSQDTIKHPYQSKAVVLPSMSDTLVIFPSYLGYVSYRDTSKGTWFVEEFVNTLKMAENEEQTEIMTLLNKVSAAAKLTDHLIGDETGAIVTAKQLPSIENNGFTAKFYLALRQYRPSL